MDVHPTQAGQPEDVENKDIENTGSVEIILESADEDLMLAYANHNDQRAFEVLYKKHKNGLYRYCVRMMNNEDLGAEIFQDAWGRVIRSREHYKVRAKFKTYLFHIAHNLIIDQWRKNSPEMLSIDDQQESGFELEADDDVVGDLEKREQVLRFRDAVKDLPPKQRDVLMLHYDHGLTLEQIAHIDGIGRETVKSRLRYAMKKLKQVLAEPVNQAEPNSQEVSND